MGPSRHSAARDQFRISAQTFFEVNEFKLCLDVMKDLEGIDLKWEEVDSDILDDAVAKEPDHLPREWVVKFALIRNAWETIRLTDLQNKAFAKFLRGHKNEPWLKKLVRDCGYGDRASVALALPALVADYNLEQQQYSEALRLYLEARDGQSAIKATDMAVEEAKQHKGDLLRVVEHWKDYGGFNKAPDEKVRLLVSLFGDPGEAAKYNAVKLMHEFGPEIVRLAVKSHSDSDATVLHSFDRNVFEDDVLKALIHQFEGHPIEVVEWYHDHDDRAHAIEFAKTNLKSWSADELLHTMLVRYRFQFESLLTEITDRSLLLNAVQICLSADNFDLSLAEDLSNRYLNSGGNAKAEDLLQTWNGVLQDNRVKTKVRGTNSPPSKIFLLLKLFTDPVSASRQFPKPIMKIFGKELVLRAVDTKFRAAAAKQQRYDVLRRFDAKAFESEKPKPKAEKPKPKEAATTVPRFSTRNRVRVRGIQSKKELNGRIGTITEKMNAEERYGVRLDGDNKDISLHEKNLSLLGSQDGDDGKMSPKKKAARPRQRPMADSSSSSDEDNNRNGRANQRQSAMSHLDSSSSSDEGGRSEYDSGETDSSGDKIPGLSNRGQGDSDASPPGLNEQDSSDYSSDIPPLDNKHSSSSDSDSDDGSDKGIPGLVRRNKKESSSSEDGSSDSGRRRPRGQRLPGYRRASGRASQNREAANEDTQTPGAAGGKKRKKKNGNKKR